MKKSSWIVLGALGTALIIYLVAQPFLIARALQNALVSQDRDALRELVDFPLLKENLKDELPSYIRTISTKDKETTETLAQFVAGVASAAMDEMITPSGLIDMTSKANKAGNTQKLSSGYSSHSRFLASMHANAGDELIFVLKRQGISWRVTDIKGVLHVLYPAEGSQASAPIKDVTDEVHATDEENGASSDEFGNTETPILDAQLQIAQEEVVMAAKATQAFEEKEEANRIAGKSFNESRISWSFACDKSIHGISILGAEKLGGLTYDEKRSVCSCVQEEVPYNVEVLLASPSRSISELGDEVYDDQVKAFGACYFRISNTKAQQAQVTAIRREQELAELKERQRASHTDSEE